jgi:hypothetical protein
LIHLFKKIFVIDSRLLPAADVVRAFMRRYQLR